MKSQGFTLIELSIVLVILGLIVGGVIGGTALVHQSRLQSVVKEINGIETALNAFGMQYDERPGDLAEATSYWASSTNGDGDGFIEWTAAASAPQDLEFRRVWDHLNRADILTNSVVIGAIGDAASPDVNCLGAKLDGCYSISTWGTNPAADVFDKTGMAITLGTANTRNIAEGGIMFAKDARSLDTKMDDGKPATGRFVTRRETLSDGSEGDGCVSHAITAAAGTAVTYTVSDTTDRCQILYFLQ